MRLVRVRPSLRPAEPLDALLREHARPKVFRRGALVIARGEVAPGLWCVESGALAEIGRDGAGRAVTLTYRPIGEWFEETTLLDGLPEFSDYVAPVMTTALHVSHRDAKRLLAAYPALREEFVRITCARLRQLTRYIELIIVPDLPARLAVQLLFIARSSPTGLVAGRPLGVHLTQSALAALCGATREAAGRHLVRWQRAGWIELRYGRITILDPDALRAVIRKGATPPASAARPISKRRAPARAS